MHDPLINNCICFDDLRFKITCFASENISVALLPLPGLELGTFGYQVCSQSLCPHDMLDETVEGAVEKCERQAQRKRRGNGNRNEKKLKAQR